VVTRHSEDGSGLVLVPYRCVATPDAQVGCGNSHGHDGLAYVDLVELTGPLVLGRRGHDGYGGC
jgi:hypothetical protein